MKRNALPGWLPLDRARRIECGVYFDAVRLSSFDATRTISRLRDRSGPVIEDASIAVIAWLVRPGSATAWDLPGVQVLGADYDLMVPPADHRVDHRLRWCGPAPGPGADCLTDSGLLHDALTETLRPQRWRR